MIGGAQMPAARTRWSGVRAGVVLVVSAGLLAGCSWISSTFGGEKPAEQISVSVFAVQPGMCFNPPAKTQAELADLEAIPCGTPHTQESYASIVYQPPAGGDASVYPGDQALATFANGACAQEFNHYVGVSYLDSALFFTYLLPSARGWQQREDRAVLCFITTTGQPLTATVKGTRM